MVDDVTEARMTDPFWTIAAIGVVPVIAIESAEDALALAGAGKTRS